MEPDEETRHNIVTQLRAAPNMKWRLNATKAVVSTILLHDDDPFYQLFDEIVSMLQETYHEEYD